MTDSGRETRAYVSAFDRSRVHQSRLYRFEKRRLVANFGALLGERQIRCATWSIDRPEIGVMSDPQISDDARETSVMFAAQLGGWATVRCQITLDSGEQYVQVFRVNVRQASWFVDDAPLSNGPFSLRVCREDPPPPPEPWELVFESESAGSDSGSGEGVSGYIDSVGRLISANTDEIAGVYSSSGFFSVEMRSDSEIPEVPPFTEVQIFEGPDFSGEPRVFLAEDIVDSYTWPVFGGWRRYWDWETPDENFFLGRDGDVFSCRLIRS